MDKLFFKVSDHLEFKIENTFDTYKVLEEIPEIQKTMGLFEHSNPLEFYIYPYKDGIDMIIGTASYDYFHKCPRFKIADKDKKLMINPKIIKSYPNLIEELNDCLDSIGNYRLTPEIRYNIHDKSSIFFKDIYQFELETDREWQIRINTMCEKFIEFTKPIYDTYRHIKEWKDYYDSIKPTNIGDEPYKNIKNYVPKSRELLFIQNPEEGKNKLAVIGSSKLKICEMYRYDEDMFVYYGEDGKKYLKLRRDIIEEEDEDTLKTIHKVMSMLDQAKDHLFTYPIIKEMAVKRIQEYTDVPIGIDTDHEVIEVLIKDIISIINLVLFIVEREED